MVHYVVDSITRTKVPHELSVNKASFLMVARLRSTWVEKGSPFCLVWVVNRVVDTMSSIEEVFCGIM